MRLLSVLLAAALALPSASQAQCRARSEPDCVPADPLRARFLAAVRQVKCHDLIRLDDQGRDLDPPAASPVSALARSQGDAAIPFYEAVIVRCQGSSPDWAAEAFTALASTGTPQSFAILERHTRPGQPRRWDAYLALLRAPGAGQEWLATQLLQVPEAQARRLLVAEILLRGDERTLPALREATRRERDASLAQQLKVATIQVEHPDECALEADVWRWAPLGHECRYTCRGVESPVWRVIRRWVLPCAVTVSRGALLGAR